MKRSSRYQHQKWYVKVWRRRHYLRIPWIALNIWRSGERLRNAWSIATGLIQVDMNWLYDWEDLKKEIK